MDTGAVDGAISKISKIQQEIERISATPARVQADASQVDAASAKLERLKQLTINGVTLTVDGDTTPADFGIKKLISRVEGEKVTIEMNPEWKKAQQKIEAAKKRMAARPVDIPVDADTQKARAKIEVIEKPTQSVHKVQADTVAAKAKIQELQKTTHSTHVVHVKTVNEHAAGGLVEKYAKGGMVAKHTERSSGGKVGSFFSRFASGGRVPGYDPTDGDTVAAQLTRGEYVIQRKAVRFYGDEILAAINAMKFPKFSTVGPVGSSSGISKGPESILNFHFNGRSFSLSGSDYDARGVAEALRKYLESEGGL